MSRHNYSQYSNNKKNDNHMVEETDVIAEGVTEEVVEQTAAPEIKMVEETVETAALPETVTGTVTNCSKLNIRTEPSTSAEIACVVNVNTELAIIVEKSTDKWLYVCTAAGIEGYCMREYVTATL